MAGALHTRQEYAHKLEALNMATDCSAATGLVFDTSCLRSSEAQEIECRAASQSGPLQMLTATGKLLVNHQVAVEVFVKLELDAEGCCAENTAFYKPDAHRE